MMSKIYCVRCKNTLDEKDTFCRHCGAPQTREANIAAQANPSPVVSIPAISRPAETDYQLEECTRQYKSLTNMLMFSFVLMLAGGVGIIFLLYATFKRPALRQKVAELGYDPEAWASPMDYSLRRAGVIIMTIVIVALGIFVVFSAGRLK